MSIKRPFRTIRISPARPCDAIQSKKVSGPIYAGQPSSIHFLKSEIRSGGQGASGGIAPAGHLVIMSYVSVVAPDVPRLLKNERQMFYEDLHKTLRAFAGIHIQAGSSSFTPAGSMH